MKWVTLAILLGVMIAVSHGATLTITADVDAAYDNTNEFDQVWSGVGTPPGGNVVFETAIYFQISDLSPSESGFGSIDFNFTSNANFILSIDPNFPYDPNTSEFKGAPPLVHTFIPYYATNEIVGTPILTSSYSSVEVEAAISSGVTSATDPRYSLGQAGPFLLGYAYVDQTGLWDGLPFLTITPEDLELNSNGVLTPGVSPIMWGERIDLYPDEFTYTPFLAAPEPATLGPLAMAASFFARRSRMRSNL